ncbi:hypothetical protein N7457_005825 [Penicillium paradoxum]|uniref:uncharacterized protein n=1 Tax=Penicillium paradoxum TaxID=176176 RepID=UPI002548BF5A|nr:uncharacterized protein N7457_005825 [Penicillium paradoxum]KAJ5780665.1 hypothetical protein N7457_005825 [Penicillium paradoxum]
MFSRSALRSLASDLRWTAPSTISSAAPLQQRACLHQSATLMNSQQPQSQSSSTHPESPLSATPRAQDSQPKASRPYTFDETTMTPQTRADVPIAKQPVAPTFTSPLKVTKSLMSQLPHLAGQKPHYVVAQLHARPYLLTEGDHIRLPFLMPNVKAGDILRFNRASAIGSREFTMKGTPTIDERMYECRVRVTGVDAEPLRIKEKTKRRNRHVKQAKSKHRYTLMRVMDVRVKTPDELLAEGAVVVEDGEDSSVIEPRS